MSVHSVPPGAVKAMLYPPTFLERWLERLIECLPRTRLSLGIQPKPGAPMRQIGSDGQEFLAESERPLLELVAHASWEGWFYLEAALGRSNGSREAFLIPRLPDGQEVASIPVPSNLRGSVREVFYLPPGVAALEFQPTAAKGFFSVMGLELHRISPVEAYLRQAHRVVVDVLDGRLSPVCSGLPWAALGLSGLHARYQESARARLLRVRRNDYTAYLTAQQRARPALGRRPGRAPQAGVVVSIMLSGEPGPLLLTTLESLQAQYCLNWEVLLGAEVAACMAWPSALADDVRIRRLDTGHWPEMIDQAQGDWLVCLTAGTCLAPECLSTLLKGAEDEALRLIYADHDLLASDGGRHSPVFKPAWNPELHLSSDYIGDACLMRRSALQAHRAWMALLEAEDAPTPGLALRLAVLDGALASQVAHVSQVLFHYPACSARVPARSRQPVVQRFLGARARVRCVADMPGLHLAYPVPASGPLVSIIIPTRNRLDLLRTCLESLQRRTAYRHFEIIIADNQSSDEDVLAYMQTLEASGQARIVRCDFPFNFSRINNDAVATASGEVLVFLNNDTEVTQPEWLGEMLAHALRPEVGVVGCRLLYGNGLVQHAGVIVGLGGAAGHWFRYLEAGNAGYAERALLSQNLSAVTGACMAMRREVFLQVGGFDPGFAVAYNDVDVCLRIRAAGYQNIYTPHAVLLHHESISRGRDDSPEKKRIFELEYARFRHRWVDLIAMGDPAYSPNLSLEDEGCSFARTFRF